MDVYSYVQICLHNNYKCKHKYKSSCSHVEILDNIISPWALDPVNKISETIEGSATQKLDSKFAKSCLRFKIWAEIQED